MVAPLIPKKVAGTFRAKGVFTCPMRLWAKWRGGGLCQEGEDTYGSAPFFAAGPGRHPLTPVWRAAVRAEGRRSDEVAGAAFLDLAAFFDSIRREQLMLEARRWHFPMAVAKLAMVLYAGPRHLQAGGFGTATVWARCGIMPGCSLCTKFAKLAVATAMIRVQARQPNVSTCIFIDDVPLTATGPRATVIHSIGSAKEHLQEELAPMGCEVAPAKMAVVASDQETARGLRRVTGAETSPEEGRRATFLGADFAAGRRRGAWQANSQLRKRIKGAGRRAGRVHRLWKAAGLRAQQIARTGLLPQAGYGAEVNGLSNSEFEAMRRLQEAGVGGRRKGRSVARQRLVDGDPAADIAAAPIVEWVREVHDMRRHVPGAIAFGDMAKFWQAARVRKVKRWADAKGPTDAIRLCLQRWGWAWPTPWTFTTEQGIDLDLLTASPQLVRWHLRQTCRRQLEE